MVIGQKWFLSWFIFWWFAHMVESSSAQWIKLIENSFWSSQSCLRRLVDHQCPGDWGRHSPLVSGQGKQDAEERAGHSAEFCTEPAAQFYTILIKTTDTCLPSNTIAFLRPVKTPLIVSIVYVRKIALWQNNVNQYRGVLFWLVYFAHLFIWMAYLVSSALGWMEHLVIGMVYLVFLSQNVRNCVYILWVNLAQSSPLAKAFRKYNILCVVNLASSRPDQHGGVLWGTR